MTKQDLINHCLTYPAAIETYPFDAEAAVMKHSANGKMFALIGIRNDRLYINLKCDPFIADILRGSFESVVPGWHMNKTHWNTVYTDGDVPESELHDMIRDSYDLIKPRRKA